MNTIIQPTRHCQTDTLNDAWMIIQNQDIHMRGSNIVFCVGSILRGDDAAGPALAKKLEDHPIKGWYAIDGGQTPEDYLGHMRRLSAKKILVVDAADMGLPPGSIRRVTTDDVAVQFLITTHTLPITYLLEELKQMCDELVFLGIQPASTEFFDPISHPVLAAIDEIYKCIYEGAKFASYDKTISNR